MLLISSSLLLSISYLHAIYISVTEIDYDANGKKFEIRIKTFTDDLEDGIYHLTEQNVSLRTRDELTQNSSLIEQYLATKFQMRINSKKAPLVFLKSENETDATWSYFETRFNGDIKSIDISNSILTELFDTQTNVVSLEVEGERRFLRFTKSRIEERLDF